MSSEQQQKPKRRPGLYDLAEMRVVAPAFTVEQVNRWLAEQRFMEQPQATATTKTSIDESQQQQHKRKETEMTNSNNDKPKQLLPVASTDASNAVVPRAGTLKHGATMQPSSGKKSTTEADSNPKSHQESQITAANAMENRNNEESLPAGRPLTRAPPPPRPLTTTHLSMLTEPPAGSLFHGLLPPLVKSRPMQQSLTSTISNQLYEHVQFTVDYERPALVQRFAQSKPTTSNTTVIAATTQSGVGTGNESGGATASFGQPAFGPTAAAAATCDLHEHGAPQTNMNDFRSNDSTNNDLQQLLHGEATSRSQKQKIRELEAILGDFGFCSFDPSLFVQADEKVDADVGDIIDKIGEVALQELQTKCLNELLSYYYRCLTADYKIPTSIRLNLSTALFIKTRRSLVLGLKSIQESPVPKPTYSQKVIAYLQWTMLCPTKQSGHSMTQFLEARIDVQEEAFKRMDAPLVKHARDLLMIKSCKSCDKAGRLDLACKTCKGERTTVGQKRLNDTFSALKQLHHALVNDDLKGGDGNP